MGECFWGEVVHGRTYKIWKDLTNSQLSFVVIVVLPILSEPFFYVGFLFYFVFFILLTKP